MFQTVKLAPGVKLEQTPTLLQMSLISSQLIRWRGGLPEKLGGWLQFYNFLIAGVARQLWAWEDLEFEKYLAVAGDLSLSVINGTQITDITPQQNTTNNPPVFGTTAGSPLVTITDVGSNATIYDGVDVNVNVSVGGLIIFGLYQVVSVQSTDEYTINAGIPALFNSTLSATGSITGTIATFTVVTASQVVPGMTITGPGVHVPTKIISQVTPLTGGETFGGVGRYNVLPTQTVGSVAITGQTAIVSAFTTVAGSPIFTVTLPDHGLVAGDSFPLAIANNIGSVILRPGLYTVLSVIDAYNFTIGAPNLAQFSDFEFDNGGNVQLILWVTPTQQAPGGGWGDGGWGLGGWGQGVAPPPVTGTKVTPNDWSIGNFGPTLLSSPVNGPIFAWRPDGGLNGSSVIGAGPSACAGFFIAMPQQQVVAYGSSDFGLQDPMLVAWSDTGSYSSWTASAINQAGNFTLTRGSRIVGGLQGPQQAFLWTDVGLWLMQYIGFPDVYGFFEIAQGCGLIGKSAAGVIGGRVFWMSLDGFWVYSGGIITRLPCDVWDKIFPAYVNLNEAFFRNIRFAPNSSYDEACWEFPSAASVSGENDSYVKINTSTGEWDFGSLTITAWVDANIFGQPISAMIDSTGSSALIMQHEVSPDANGEALLYSYQTGFFMLSDGEDKVFVDFMLPDFKWNRQNQPLTTSAQILLTLYTQDNPDDPTEVPDVYGPFVVTNATGGIEPRARGRYFSIQVSGQDQGSFSRLGGIKFRFAPDGRN